MAITFVSKTGKKRSLLIDALRILAWEEYKATNKESLKNLEYGGYEVFEAEWKVHEIHQSTYPELVTFAKSLEFAENELLNLRSNHYAKKSNYSRSSTNGSSGTGTGTENLQETASQLASVVSEAVPDEVPFDSDDSSEPLPKYDEQPF